MLRPDVDDLHVQILGTLREHHGLERVGGCAVAAAGVGDEHEHALLGVIALSVPRRWRPLQRAEARRRGAEAAEQC
jgi:hypothetical protein